MTKRSRRGKAAKGRGLNLSAPRQAFHSRENMETNYSELRKRHAALFAWVDHVSDLPEHVLLTRLADPAGSPGLTGLDSKEIQPDRVSSQCAIPRGRVVCPGCGTVVSVSDQFGLVLFRAYSELKFRLRHQKPECKNNMESRFHILYYWEGSALANLPQDIIL